MEYLNWSDKDHWPLLYFTPQELACKGSGALRVNPDAAFKLDGLRADLAHPLIVVSGYRTQAHNAAVGGAPDSWHIKGGAFDLRWPGGRLDYLLVKHAQRRGFTGLGFYPGFIHVDIGPPRVWVGR